jgi:hypothetical protein
MFTRINGQTGSERKICVTNKGSNKLLELIPDVNKAISEGKEMDKVLLDGSLYVSYGPYKDVFYVKLQYYTKFGTRVPNQGFNFKNDEWISFTNQKEAIPKALELKMCRKRGANGMKKINLTMYKWKWMVGNKIAKESQEGFFSEENCKTNAYYPENKVKGTDKHIPKLVVQTSSSPAPDPCQVMQYCFLKILDETILKIMFEKCEGCKTDHGSLNEHKDGCAESGNVVRQKYVKIARYSSHTKSLVTLYDTICRMYGMEPIDSKLLARSCQFFMTTDSVLVLLAKPQFISIEMLVKDVYHKCFFE